MGPGRRPAAGAVPRAGASARAPELFALLYEVGIVEGDRRDVLAFRHLGDAELWWRLADANGIVDPRDIASPVGRRLRITLPEGVPGPDA